VIRLLVTAAAVSAAVASAASAGPPATRAARTLAPALGPPSALPSPAGPGSSEPHLSRSRDGEVWMSWLEPREGGGHALRAAKLVGQTWSAPVNAAEGDSFFVNWADRPSVLALGGGRLAAHWLRRFGPETYSYEIRIAFSGDSGRTWSRPLCPHRDATATEHGFVSLLPEMDGVRAFWLDGRNFAVARANWHPEKEGEDSEHEHAPQADMTLRTALVHPDGSLSDEAELDGRACDCCPTAAVGLVHGLLIAYRDRSPEEVRDIALIRRMDGAWSGIKPLHADAWKIAGCPVNGPAMDAAVDRVAIAWYSEAGGSARVFAAFSKDRGKSFGAPIGVDQGAPLGRVDVALLEDGSALVLWLETHGSAAQILARRVREGSSRSPPVTIAETVPWRTSGVPRLVRDGGRVIFAWTEAGYPSQVRVAEAAAHTR
jgi:hypothetical protein